MPRGKNWAPSSDSEEEEKPAQPTALVRSHNPFQPALDALFKPIGELLCPMLMPASHDALVREYCEELEKDRSHLAQQNMALEKELEKLKLSAAKRQRGKTVKEGSLDKFVAMRVAVRQASRAAHKRCVLSSDAPAPRRRWPTCKTARRRMSQSRRVTPTRRLRPRASPAWRASVSRASPRRVQAAWTAWDKRDRPITDRQAARAASRQDRRACRCACARACVLVSHLTRTLVAVGAHGATERTARQETAAMQAAA